MKISPRASFGKFYASKLSIFFLHPNKLQEISKNLEQDILVVVRVKINIIVCISSMYLLLLPSNYTLTSTFANFRIYM